RAFIGGVRATPLERVLKMGGIAGLSLFPIIMSELLFAPFGVGKTMTEATAYIMTGGFLSGIGYLTMLQRRRDVDSAFWGKVWTGRLGKWMFKIARAVLPQRALPAAMTHRPTEMVIAMAADQLFA